MSCISKYIEQINNIMTKRKTKPICGDTNNLLTHQDKNFDWSVMYQWYLNLGLEDKQINNVWSIGLDNVACVLEVFEFNEIVCWCDHCFNPKTRTSKLTLKKLVVFNSKDFRKVLKPQEPNRELLRLMPLLIPKVLGWTSFETSWCILHKFYPTSLKLISLYWLSHIDISFGYSPMS